MGAGILSAALFGCATAPPSPVTPPYSGEPSVEQGSPAPGEPAAGHNPAAAGQSGGEIKEVWEKGKATANHYSRVAASNSFTGIGKRLLAKGDPDGAIRMLERSVGINPNDGPGYYYLAESWLMKENPLLAEQFNRLARVHLAHDKGWLAHADAQLVRIQALAE